MTSIDLFTQESGNQDVALIKIDVQGYEVEVCYGMVETITKNKGIMILIELSPIALADLGFNFEEVFDFFQIETLIAIVCKMVVLLRLTWNG